MGLTHKDVNGPAAAACLPQAVRHGPLISVGDESGALTTSRPVVLFLKVVRCDHVTPVAVQPANTVHQQKI